MSDHSTPSPDAASVKPACPWCGSEMTMEARERGFRYSCQRCGALSPPCTTESGAFKAAARRPARELTDNEMSDALAVGWVAFKAGGNTKIDYARGMRAAVNRALAIVRGEP